ncbi:hypothetical protein ANME2D_01451 [Candidatus Methanoperedens nitroreducens]|uniref:Uncharacterized protein n=1 Tax=Candidatus Methanoperedens nitratireducens TaxID=1392998 RepID=A0A062V9L9_9EURY|nr:hypothetical protein ANME2D_01451 [Candidatus Methanoperedens nitroreducens]
MQNNNRPILEYIQDTIKALCSENGLTDLRTLLQIIDGTLRNIKKSMRKLTTLDVVDVHVSNIIRLIKKLYTERKKLKMEQMYPSREYLTNTINSTIIYLKNCGTRYCAKLELYYNIKKSCWLTQHFKVIDYS